MCRIDEGPAQAARRPRLLYLASSFPYGQNDTFFGPEVRELVRQGVDLLAVPVRPRGLPTTPDAEPLTVKRSLLDPGIAGAALVQLASAPRVTLAAFLLLFRSPRPNVLLRNLAAFPKALWLARFARNWGADHIHAHWAGPPSTVALVASRLSGIPWSFTAHASEIYAGNLLREKCRAAAFVRFIATAMMERARSVAPDLDESRWVLLRLGVDLPEPPSGSLASNNPPVVLMAASFVAGKRQQVVLLAAKRLIEQGAAFEIWFAGSGPLEREARRRARRLKLDRVVRFYGYVPNAQILDWLARGLVDIVVLASEAEGIPVSLVEALAHEVPVVASDVGGVSELLGDEGGIVVPPEDPQALADALARLLSSPELRAGYARAGRERVEREFAVTSVVDRLRVLLGFTNDA